MDRDIANEIRSKLDVGGPRRPMLIGMAVILVVVAVVAGFVLSDAATASKFEIKQSSEVEPVGEESVGNRTVFVHVSGAVNAPGLYEVEQGSRVADAVQAAGGFAEDADADSCNLARLVEDGEHIIVGREGERSSPDGISVVDAGSVNNTGVINLNTASAAQLETLPGIGASTAAKIVGDRESNGPFKSVQDLMRVSGIGEKKLEALIGLVCV